MNLDPTQTRIGCLIRATALVLTLSMPGSAAFADSVVVPLTRAHAHNDYYHDRPLLDALSFGFCSVEADVFPIDGQLLVAHSRFELKPENDLESLYLKPLAERVRLNEGKVYKNGPMFTLLVDFKSDAETSYAILTQLLEKYQSMLDVRRDGRHIPGAVRVVISGDRPFEAVRKAPVQLAMIDGRLTDLESDEIDSSVTMISDRWGKHFTWDGEGQISESELAKLRMIIRKTHKQGRVLRFWATPDRESVWELLNRESVDLINTDDLPGLSAFLKK